jgi:Flp pilus assembly protein TadG
MNRHSIENAWNSERGDTMVETAISLVLFLTLLFGIVGWGQVMWAYMWTAHAAREGSRWASVRSSTSASPATSANIATQIKAHAFGLNTSTNRMTINATWNPNWNTGNVPGKTVKVQVQYAVNPHVPFVPSMTVSSTSEMYIAQ